MKLFFAIPSPFARKVRVTAHECGLAERLELISTNPYESAELYSINPLGKIPALVTDSGAQLYDSNVICEYLDDLSGKKLFPSGEQRWTALRLLALADGMMDSSVARVQEGRRPASEQSQYWHERRRKAVNESLTLLEKELALFSAGTVSIAEISIGCALGYLDFRFEKEDWRTGRNGLAQWYLEFSKRPSMQTTIPE